MPLKNVVNQGDIAADQNEVDEDIGGIHALIAEAIAMKDAQGEIEISDHIVLDDSLSVASDPVSSIGIQTSLT